MPVKLLVRVMLCAFAASCATDNRKPDVPFPAFVETDVIEEQFLAALPGVRARTWRSDARTRTLSGRVDIPFDWKGTTGGEPGKSLEIFILDGELRFSEFALGPGGYAYVPPGSLGFRLESDIGAQVLYFVEEVDPSAVIRSPIIIDTNLLEWQQVMPGVFERELRSDPGSGARTWLRRIEPGARLPWQSINTAREGYLVSGRITHTECVDGQAATWEYLPGGYFLRPPNTINGGPAAGATIESTWFLRQDAAGRITDESGCAP